MYSTHDLLAATAIRINALVGTDPAALQTTYSTRPLTDELFISSIFPFNAIRDSLVQAQGKLAQAIAFSENRVYRQYLLSTTSPLASGTPLPAADNVGKPIIGNFGTVRDGADQTITLTRMPVPLVRNRLLATGIYLAPVYYYALTPTEILHTRTTVVMDCCVWDADQQTAKYDQNDTFSLADDLVEAVICGACAGLIRDDEFMEQGKAWAAYFETAINRFPPAKMEAQAA